MDSISLLPLPYFLCIFVFILFAWQAWQARDEGWGVPMLTVLATVGAWYLGDPLYNGYQAYLKTLGEEGLTDAWWEVLIFLVSFRALVPAMNRQINGTLTARGSHIFQAIRNGLIDTEKFQNELTSITRMLFISWAILMLIALMKTDFDFVGMFFPYLAEKADPWSRGRIGYGFDAFLALAGYVQSMLVSLFGVAFALSKQPSTMSLAGLVYFLGAPFYVFDRTRNMILAVLLPGFMALVTMRLKGGMIVRLAVIIAGFIVLEGWMRFVIENRDKGSITQAFNSHGSFISEKNEKKHLGFNMFEELGYINYFINHDIYKINWGERYFAEAVNPIPRALWPEKPLIGIDYAIARGMAYGKQSAASGGVACSVSTGMIGQGVVNFGQIFGPIAAAILMAIWVAILTRQDLLGNDIGHMLLYAIGLVLTFNMGRDITLLVTYPFIFGLILLKYFNRNKNELVVT